MSHMQVFTPFTGRIYKVTNLIDDRIYIGSTRQDLSMRMASHRRDARDGENSNFFTHMRNLGIDNFQISLIKELYCETVDDLEIEEQEEQDKYDKKILLNQRNAFGTDVQKFYDYKNKWRRMQWATNPEYRHRQTEIKRLCLERKKQEKLKLLLEEKEALENTSKVKSRKVKIVIKKIKEEF